MTTSRAGSLARDGACGYQESDCHTQLSVEYGSNFATIRPDAIVQLLDELDASKHVEFKNAPVLLGGWVYLVTTCSERSRFV
jgi:hypothetical protein